MAFNMRLREQSFLSARAVNVALPQSLRCCGSATRAYPFATHWETGDYRKLTMLWVGRESETEILG